MSLSKYFQLTDNQYRFRRAQSDKSSYEDFLDLFLLNLLQNPESYLQKPSKSNVMKRMRIFLVITVFLGIVIAAQAQTRTVARVYPKHGTIA